MTRVATMSCGSTNRSISSETQICPKLRHPFTTRGHDHGPWKGSWGFLTLMGVGGAGNGQGITGSSTGHGDLKDQRMVFSKILKDF